MSRSSQALRILCLAVTLGVVFAVFMGLGPWRAELAENNFQANLIRLQAFLFDPPPRAVLVGSSISGRLLPSYFAHTKFAPLANLGLDGSGPVFGLEFVLKQPPPLVLIEENALLRPGDGNDETLRRAVGGLEFRAARYVPLLRADRRPSSLLYSWLKRRQDAPANTSPALTVTATKNRSGPGKHEVSRPNIEEWRTRIVSLLEHHSHIVLLRLPAGHPETANDNPAFAAGDELAKEFNLRQLDLAAECSLRGYSLKYTDGLHLTPSSAREVSRLLAELLERTDSTPGVGEADIVTGASGRQRL